MKQEIAERWAAALRSGEYKQTRSELCTIEGEQTRHCCLGVLCELAVDAGVIEKTEYRREPNENADVRGFATFGARRLRLPRAVQQWAGVRSSKGELAALVEMSDGAWWSLATANDDGMSFDAVANVVERHWRDL